MSWSAVMPRSLAVSSMERSIFSASMVAWMTLCGFEVPMHLVRMSCTPATSSSGRTSVPGVYAVGMLRGRRDAHHRLGFLVPFVFASIAAVTQPFVGHVLGFGLDENAIQALKQWRFRPGMRNGVPVDVSLNIEVNFNLR